MAGYRMILKHKWSVCKRDGQWRVLARGVWYDTFDTLPEAHTYATQCAYADSLYEPGGLTCLTALTNLAAKTISDRILYGRPEQGRQNFL